MSFDELLEELQGQKTRQEDPDHISLDALFNESFMQNCSNLETFAEFLEKGNFQVNTQEEIEDIPDELLDRHVARETSFSSWESMLSAANAANASQ